MGGHGSDRAQGAGGGAQMVATPRRVPSRNHDLRPAPCALRPPLWQPPCSLHPRRFPLSLKPVLVVDDDDAIRTLVGRVLRREKFEVESARDGHEAIRSEEHTSELQSRL